jgi:hypothetical protein
MVDACYHLVQEVVGGDCRKPGQQVRQLPRFRTFVAGAFFQQIPWSSSQIRKGPGAEGRS